MGIKRATIKDFQSIKDLNLEFGKFTVLVGPSSSGKSAALRAIKSLLRNSFVPTNVRQGAPKSVVSVDFDDVSVSSERGKSLSTYYLGTEAFTKSGRSVPEPITKAIKFPLIEGVDPSFSFQFDKPFLLSESGSTAAGVIGSLTNVSLLHQAVREANRRRSEASSTLKVRRVDEEALLSRVGSFTNLKGRKEALDEARQKLLDVKRIEAENRELRRLVVRIEQADSVLNNIDVPEVVDVSDKLAGVESLVSMLGLLRASERAAITNLTQIQKTGKLVVSTNEEIAQLSQDYDKLLRDAGVCPVCGKKTH